MLDAKKKSRGYNVLGVVVAILPLVDIVTSYSWIFSTLASDNTPLEGTMALICLLVMWMTSRQILWMRFLADKSDKYEVTIENIVVFNCPFLDLCVFYNLEADGDEPYQIEMYTLAVYFFIFFTAPVTHLMFVLYCVYNQMISQLFHNQNFPPFAPLIFLQIMEIIPQLVMHALVLLMFSHGESLYSILYYTLSTLASVLIMSKAIVMYYQRYAVVKKGFTLDSIDDSAYILELVLEIYKNAWPYEQLLPEICKVIEKMKAQNISFKDRVDKGSGDTALILASGAGLEKVVELLLQNGADHAVANNSGDTALICASREGHEKVVHLLLQAGADHHANDTRGGDTALILASENGHEKVVDLLLQAGADHAVVNKDGGTALILASSQGHEKVVDLLQQAGADHANVNDQTTVRLKKKWRRTSENC